MPKFKIREGGKSYVITVPEGTSQEQAYEYLKQHRGDQQQQPRSTTADLARGAARGLAGNVTDAWKLSQTPVLGSALGAVFPPVQALRLASEKPGGAIGERDPHTEAIGTKIEDFANAPSASGAESIGYVASQVLPTLLMPAAGVGRVASGVVRPFMSGFARGWASKTGQQIPRAVQDFLAHHATRHLGGMARRTLGVPEFAGSRTLRAGIQAGGRTEASEQENERRKGSPQNNPPALPPYSGSPL